MIFARTLIRRLIRYLLHLIPVSDRFRKRFVVAQRRISANRLYKRAQPAWKNNHRVFSKLKDSTSVSLSRFDCWTVPCSVFLSKRFILIWIVDFCWMCCGDWRSHGSEYYECSRYKSNPNIVNESAGIQAREALKKYLFYFERVCVSLRNKY